MTMRDFIYYLPDTNPMLSSFGEEKRPPFPVLTKEPEVGTINPPAEDEGEESDDAVLGPRVKVAEDGSIIIDEESLTVEVLRKKGPIVEENDPIFERGSQTTYSSFRKSTHTKPWSNKETDMFFLAISMVGTDFSMIGQLFPNRTRIEIKNKFKREEKLNSWRIDKAFKEKKPLDLDFFGALLNRVLEAESKRKKEKDEKTKSQGPRKPSRSKRNRKGKNVTELESDPDDPDPVEVADTELAEADSNAVAEGTEASCSVECQEDASKKESTSKPYPTKCKRKRKKKSTPEPAEQETAEDPPQEGSTSQKLKQEVQQCKIGIPKSSALTSAEEDSSGDQIAEHEDECLLVNSEISLEQETSENKLPSKTHRKANHNDEGRSLSDHESVAPSETSPPVTTETSKKSRVRAQKFKPNSKAIGTKRAGDKNGDQTAPEAIRFYDGDNKEDKSEKVQESPVQDVDPPNCDPPEIMNNEVSEKESNSSPISETAEADKTKKILENKTQGSDTESWPMEKQEESMPKPNHAARRRFQKPKPNLGRAVVLIVENKIAPEQEKVVTTEEERDLSPDIAIAEVREASEKTGADSYFASEAQTVDTLIHSNVQRQQDALQGSSEASKPIAPISQSRVQSLEAATNSMEIEAQSIVASDNEMPRTGYQDSSGKQQSQMPSEYDSQEEHEDLKLDSVQDNIISKPTRSGRQPRPTAFYKSPTEQKPSSSSPLLPEAENEDKSRNRRARSQKTKPKLNKGLNKKEINKNAGKGQGTSKVRLVTLRASQEDEEDDEPEPIKEDDVYLINPEEVNKVPAFVPISLRSPEPVQTEVEETMEELEIAVNVCDKNYDSETEQTLCESPDKSEPSQSCSLTPEEDYHPEATDQIELFVEVIEIASEDLSQEEDYDNTESADGFQDAAYTSIGSVDQKSLEQEAILGGDPSPMQVEVHDTAPDGCTESSRCDEQHIPTENNLKDGLDLEESSLPKEDSHNASISSTVTEQTSLQTNQAIKRCRFLKPKPNLSKTTRRSHANKTCPITESRPIQNSVESSETTLQKSKQDNESKDSLGDSLQLRLVTAETDKQRLNTEQISFGQPNDKVSLSDEQGKCVGNQDQMNKTEHLGCSTEQLWEKLSIFEQQDMGHGKQPSRTEHLVDEIQHVGKQSSINEQQDQYVEDEEQLSRTQHLDDETQHVVEQLSVSEQQNQCVEAEEEQPSRTQHLDDETQHVVEQLSVSEQQNQCVEGEEELLSRTHRLGEQLLIPKQQNQWVEDEEQLRRTAYLGDETQYRHEQLSTLEQQDQCMKDEEGQSSRTHHLGEQLSVLKQQNQWVEDEEQLRRTAYLGDETQYRHEQLSTLEQQDQCMKDEEGQSSRTQHLGEQLSILKQQNQWVEDEEQLRRTAYLGDETQYRHEQLSTLEQQDQCMKDEEGQSSRTQHLGKQLSILKQQNQWVEDEDQLERAKQLDARIECLSASVSPANDQRQTTSESQEAQSGMSCGAYFSQSTLSRCQRTDAKLSIGAPESNADVSYFGYSQQINIIEAQNAEHQETSNTSEENLEHMMEMGNPNEETFVLTLVEIPVSSLTDYDASSASFTPVSEGTLTVVEPVLPLPTENVEVSESVSSEPPMEAPTVSSFSDSVSHSENTQQQWSSNVPRSNIGQMQRKRKAHAFGDEQDSPTKKSPAIISINEESTEKVQLNEGMAQSKLATFTSPEECPAAVTSGILNSSATEMNFQLESREGFISVTRDSISNPVPIETVTETHSESLKEIKKPSSRIRRGKLTVKPNISTKRGTCTLDTSLPGKSKDSLKLSRTPKNSPSGKSLHAEPACNLSVDMDFSQQKLGSAFCNQDQTDGQIHTATTEAGHSAETLAVDIHVGATVNKNVDISAEQSESSMQETPSTSGTNLTRPGRKPRGFLSFISKKPSENESETKLQRTKFLKPRMNLPRFAGKRPIPSEENPEETKINTSPVAKGKSFEKPGGHQLDSRSIPTEVKRKSSLQSWQSESYTEEVCCAMEEGTEQMQPTRVAEYFFSDIFTEVEEDEEECS
ncbi:transcription factor TFIIIB component B'' homolog isoform X2 [Stegostoma tigrinum]|uniref:transcription factor TFIIIB component B'' homolog isoform X2 n=1 Tax=Stegostoma tigrinum TaxID=3053191 RepID=UPI00286FC557|nr:transcription factor TFIIIB component B'' homolog isoform X2 [Stegostoma tigrinum]